MTLSLLVFHLWSKGWSPQYALAFLPFLLLSFPGRGGLAAVLLFSALVTMHWPATRELSPLFILARTLFLIVVACFLVRRLWPAAVEHASILAGKGARVYPANEDLWPALESIPVKDDR